MTPRGRDFLLEIGPHASTVEKLLFLESAGLLPIAARRRKNLLYVTLRSQSDTQRVAEVVGPSVPVSARSPPSSPEAPPGTDWVIRLVGERAKLEASIGSLLSLLDSTLAGISQTDIVGMGLVGVQPAVMDLRLSCERPSEFATRRVPLLDFGDKSGLPLLVQPLSIFKRPKGLVCFDLDSTLVSEELIIEVARRMGKEAEVGEITRRAMAGELDYEMSFIHRVALLRGAKEEDLAEIWEGIATASEVQHLLSSLRMRGAKTAILSGAFTFYTERARDRLGVDFAIGNEVDIREGVLTGDVRGPIINAAAKLEKMKEFAEQLNLTLEDVVAVGDGANDIDIVREAGTGIAYDKGGIVKSYADGVLPHGRLGDLIHLIGR